MKKTLSDLTKNAVLVLGVLWITHQCFLVKTVHATPLASTANGTPMVKHFSFMNPQSNKYYVTSWFEDGVKCTALTPSEPTSNANSLAAAISCVKM